MIYYKNPEYKKSRGEKYGFGVVGNKEIVVGEQIHLS
jgi:hypothetical protein